MPRTMTRRITDRQLQIVTPYLEGMTKSEAALTVGVAPDTVASALTNIRAQLRAEGYRGIHTAIGLRKALRKRGDLNSLEWI